MGLPVPIEVWTGAPGHTCVPTWVGSSLGSPEIRGIEAVFPVPSKSPGLQGSSCRPDPAASHRCHPYGGAHRPRRAQYQPGYRAPQLLPEQPRPAAGAPAPLSGEGSRAGAAWPRGDRAGRRRRAGAGQEVMQSPPFSPPPPPRRSPASQQACLVSGVTERRKGGVSRYTGGAGGLGSGGASRRRARVGITLAGSPGYPNEAAAEVVLTALREWLEQHKDKVRPGPSRGKWTGWDGGGIPALLTSPMSHCGELGCPVPSPGISSHASPSYIPLPFPQPVSLRSYQEPLL